MKPKKQDKVLSPLDKTKISKAKLLVKLHRKIEMVEADAKERVAMVEADAKERVAKIRIRIQLAEMLLHALEKGTR